MNKRNRKYFVKLTEEERQQLEAIVRKGKSAAWKIQRAQALLKMDQGPDGPGWNDARIAEAFGMSVRSLESWRKQAVEEGPESLLERRYQPTRPSLRKLDGEGEARLTMLACSRPPGDRAHWTLQLLADQLVELQVVDAISDETVRRTLKKTTLSPG